MDVTLPTRQSEHCTNVKKDRETGGYWEQQFGIMAAGYEKSFSFLQKGKTDASIIHTRKNGKWNKYTSPDVMVWTSPGEHHEIKHKNPFYLTRQQVNVYGLEVYRFEALLWLAEETGQHVMYTIHDHDKAGGPDIETNSIDHWVTANILQLNNRWVTKFETVTWYNGQRVKKPAYYWPTTLWTPLETFWKLM